MGKLPFIVLRTISVFSLFCLFTLPTHASSFILDSLKRELSTEKNDVKRVDTFNELANQYWKLFATDARNDANFYADSALTIASKINYPKGIARALYLKGRFLVTYRSFDKSTSYLLQSLAIFERLKDANGIADCYLQLGVISFSMDNFPEAQIQFKRCIANGKINDHTLTTGHYLLAISFSETDSIDQALKHFNFALNRYIINKDSVGLSQCYTYMGKMFINIGENEKAIEFLNKGVDIGNKIYADKSGQNRAYAFLATANFQAGRIEEAIKCGELALNPQTWKVSDWITGKEAMATLSNAYAHKGKYEKAFSYLKKLNLLNDSIYGSNIINNTAELRSKFEFEGQLSRMKAAQDIINEKQKSDFEKQKLLRNSMLYISILVIVLLLVLLNRFRLKQRHAEQLAVAYNNLKQTQEQLIQQEKLASLGALSAGIAHEIKNPLNFVTNFSQISIDLVNDFISTDSETERTELGRDLKVNLEKIIHHGKRADSIVQSMLLHVRSSSEEKQLTDINSLCNDYVDLSYLSMRVNADDFICEVIKELDPRLPKILVQQQDIGRVILNIVNNAFYAVKQKKQQQQKINPSVEIPNYFPTVSIKTSYKSGNIIIIVRDNASGIPEELRKKIFEPFFTTKPSGDGTGLGLSICFDIVKAHGGDIKVESSVNEFTQFSILLPR